MPDHIQSLLEEKAARYNTPAFIEEDPVQIPHSFSERKNIEISGFLAATLAWGRRDVIIRNTLALVRRMDNRPIDFLMDTKEKDLEIFRDFRHRTFGGEDCIYFMRSLQRKQNDWKAVEELTGVLRQLDPSDPVRYDYALFGLGLYENS